jgi:uncharacterized OB-fold protein
MNDYFDGPGPEAIFREHLAEGRFMIQRSVSTGLHVFYPRVVTPGSGEADLEWVEASGAGVVYATTLTRRRAEQGGDYNISLIDLAEGPRMMSRVVGIAPEKVTIGLKVRAKVDELNGAPAVLFEPV